MFLGRKRSPILASILAGACLAQGCSADPPKRPATLAPDSPEARAGFVSLFNGENLAGWVVAGPNQEAFHAEDGVLVCNGGGGEWVRTDKQYSDFDLRLEYKIGHRGNSGLFFRSDPVDPVFKGMEIQIYGDYGREPKTNTSGALYDVVAPSETASRPDGEWNSLELICRDGEITVIHNGKTVIHEDFDDEKFAEPIGKFPTPYRDMPRTGYIGLQDHGYWVWFRDIRIKDLSPSDSEPETSPAEGN